MHTIRWTHWLGFFLLVPSFVVVEGCKKNTTQAQSPQARKTQPTSRRSAPKHRDINARFVSKKMNPKSWKKRFENPKREVFRNREAIVAAIKIKPGTALADVGAGSGAFMEPFVKAVGAKGKVYAVDISPNFVKFLRKRIKDKGYKQAQVVHSTTTSTKLPANSVDLIFVCDTYHHFDKAKSMLADFHQALRKGGRLVIVDFKRIPGVSSKWILNHVKVNEKQVTTEILANGFKLVKKYNLKELKDNYMLMFERTDK